MANVGKFRFIVSCLQLYLSSRCCWERNGLKATFYQCNNVENNQRKYSLYWIIGISISVTMNLFLGSYNGSHFRSSMYLFRKHSITACFIFFLSLESDVWMIKCSTNVTVEMHTCSFCSDGLNFFTWNIMWSKNSSFLNLSLSCNCVSRVVLWCRVHFKDISALFQPKGKKAKGKKVAPAPSVAKKHEVKKVVNPLFEKRPKNFGIGE